MGTETVPGTAVCTGGNGRHPEHLGKHQPCTGAAVGYPVLQLPVPDRMHLPGTEAAGWRILLPLLACVPQFDTIHPGISLGAFFNIYFLSQSCVSVTISTAYAGSVLTSLYLPT